MLSSAFQSQNPEQFRNALSSGEDAQLEDPKTRISIFNFICQTPDSAQFIKLCIEDGHCDVNRENSLVCKRPIHFCVESLDAGNLAELLSHNPDVNTQYETKTPIYLLCSFLSHDNFTKIFDCIKTLLNHECNVNIPDRKNVTPILLLGWSEVLGVEQIIKYILDNASVDLDQYRDGEARTILTQKFPTMELPPNAYHIERM